MIAAEDKRGRYVAGVTVAAIHGLIVAALILGLGTDVPARFEATLETFQVLPDPPPPRRVVERRARPQREGAAAPPNLRSRATPVVAPPPVLVMPPPPPLIVAAPLAGIGSEATAGAAPVPGPGSGSGGEGLGTGSGGAGDGEGGGGTPLRWLKGSLRDEDYPRRAGEAGIGGTVGLRFVVGVKGRVTSCTVTKSSGNADLDETTCRLIKQRLRYRPTLDASGRPVPDTVEGEHVWKIVRQPDVDLPDAEP